MWLIDKLFNRKIEGESSLDALEPVADKVEVYNGDVKFKSGAIIVGDQPIWEEDGAVNVNKLAVSSDVNASGDLTAKTLSQSEANWSLDLEDISLANLPANCEATHVYSRFEVINNVLHVIVNLTIKNNGESTINSFNGSLSVVNIPSSIGEKIIDFNDEDLTDEPTTSGLILADVYFTGTYPALGSRSSKEAYLQHYAQNTMRINLNGIPVIAAGGSIYVSFRTQLTLI